MSMFGLVVEMNGRYFAGHAGTAESKTLIVATLPPGAERNGLLKESEQDAARVLEFGIHHSGSPSAATLVAMVNRDFKSVRQQSGQAVSLDPTDVSSLNMDALISLFGGDFRRTKEVARRIGALIGERRHVPQQKHISVSRIPLWNLSGCAQYE